MNKEHKRLLKRELMREMINVMIASIYKDGGKPMVPLTTYTTDMLGETQVIRTEKFSYYKIPNVVGVSSNVNKKITDDRGVNYTWVDTTFSESEKSYKYLIVGKGNTIAPVDNSELKMRMGEMFLEVYGYG